MLHLTFYRTKVSAQVLWIPIKSRVPISDFRNNQV